MGLVLNRPLGVHLDEVWQVDQGICGLDEELRQGGPVDGPLMLLHQQSPLAQMQVLEGVCFSAEQRQVMRLVQDGCPPTRCFAGYAGWGARQLEDEVKAGSWWLCPADADLVFERDPQRQYRLACERAERGLGWLARQGTQLPVHPEWN